MLLTVIKEDAKLSTKTTGMELQGGDEEIRGINKVQLRSMTWQ